ncbi:hypothetical protein BGX29_006565 [Mortierella sp. GBA35]|nr:hypothetical protein BGX29_006565 [Mortierella sp. GBA35]
MSTYFFPTLHSAPIPPPRSSSTVRNQQVVPIQPQVVQATRPESFYAEADFEDAPAAFEEGKLRSDDGVEEDQGSTEDYDSDQEQGEQQDRDNVGQNDATKSGHQYPQQQQQPEYEISAEELIRPVAALMQLDLEGELIYFRDRLAGLQHGQPDVEKERIALLELEKSTEALMNSRKVLSDKQRQLLLLHINDSRRPNLQAEVALLTTESRSMEHQWRTGKEVYHQDYVVAAAAAAAAAAAKANAELRAQTEKDIVVLREQIANLQRQLDAVAARRANMLFATQGAALARA